LRLRLWGGSRPPRKFVNQEHHSAWLSRVRYVGGAIDGPNPVNNHARGDCYRGSLRGRFQPLL